MQIAGVSQPSLQGRSEYHRQHLTQIKVNQNQFMGIPWQSCQGHGFSPCSRPSSRQARPKKKKKYHYRIPKVSEDNTESKVYNFQTTLNLISVFHLLLAALGRLAVCGLSLGATSGRFSVVAVHGLFTAVASLVSEHGLQGTQASVIAACRLSSCASWSLRAQSQQLWHTGLVAQQHVGFSQARNQTNVPCIAKWILNHQGTREALQLTYYLRDKAM